MRKAAFVALLALILISMRANAGEIAVKWKKAAEGITKQGYQNENQLPAGAKVTVKVMALDNNKTPQRFYVNEQEHTAKTEGDVFSAKVDGNGKLTIYTGSEPEYAGPDLLHGASALRWGQHTPPGGGAARWRLMLNVKVQN